MKNKKILIAGGHLSPAVALIDELDRQGGYSISYVGRLHALEGDSSYSLEYMTIRDMNIPFYSLIAGRLERHFGISFFISLFKIPVGFIQAFYYFLKIDPDVVVAFGGYVSLPLGIISYLMNVPFVIDEQTKVLGLSNRILSRFADMTFLSFAETKHVPKNIKAKVIGIPKRVYRESRAKKEMTDFGNKKLPLIFVTGGSLGSRSINHLIGDTLSLIVTKYRVIHQCGRASENKDLVTLQSEQKKMSKDLQKNYYVFSNCDYDTFYFIAKSADIVIGRSGANTVADLSDMDKRCIFIPLPWSGGNEQLLNAQEFLKDHPGVILEQKDANPAKIMEAIESVVKMPLSEKKKEKSEIKMSSASYMVNVINSL